MWHHPPAQPPSAMEAFPLLPGAVVPSWAMQEKKLMGIQSWCPNAWAMPWTLVVSMGLAHCPWQQWEQLCPGCVSCWSSPSLGES